jgi:hypothetical protein
MLLEWLVLLLGGVVTQMYQQQQALAVLHAQWVAWGWPLEQQQQVCPEQQPSLHCSSCCCCCWSHS